MKEVIKHLAAASKEPRRLIHMDFWIVLLFPDSVLTAFEWEPEERGMVQVSSTTQEPNWVSAQYMNMIPKVVPKTRESADQPPDRRSSRRSATKRFLSWIFLPIIHRWENRHLKDRNTPFVERPTTIEVENRFKNEWLP